MTWQKMAFYSSFVAVIAVAVWFRFSGRLDWDEGTHSHPDELHLTNVVLKIQYPSSITQYFDTNLSPLNPLNRGFKSYVYGTLPLFLTKVVADVTGYSDRSHVHLVGRLLSGIFDVGTVILLFVLGTMIGGPWLGFLAGLLLAATVLHIQHAHFFVVDAPATFFATLYIIALREVSLRGCYRAYLGAGVCMGLALACKLSILPLIALLPIAAIISDYHWSSSPLGKKLLGAVLFVLAAFIIFRLLQPYAFGNRGVLSLDPRYLSDLRLLWVYSNKASSFPPSLQWIDQPWWFAIENMLLWGLGPGLGALTVLGLLWYPCRVLCSKDFRLVMPFFACALFLTMQSLTMVKVMRYLLPVYPMLVLLAAYAARELCSKENGIIARTTGGVVVTIVCFSTLLWALSFSAIYRRPFVRAEATRWISEHVRPGSVAATEEWDYSLPAHGVLPVTPFVRKKALPIFKPDSMEKAETMAGILNESTYVFINSHRGYGSVGRSPDSLAQTIRYYQYLFDGSLGFSLLNCFESFPRILGYPPYTPWADESLSVYDHPPILLFQKVRALAKEDYLRLLTSNGETGLPPPHLLMSQAMYFFEKGHCQEK